MFVTGDMAVYPAHGVGVIESIESKFKPCERCTRQKPLSEICSINPPREDLTG